MAKPEPMEMIHETCFKPRTPVMVGPAAEIMMFTVKPKNKTTQDRDVPMVQPGRSASMKAAITKKTSVRIRNWVKRSNSSGEIVSRGPNSSWPEITHLGGGRVNDEQNPITEPSPIPRSRAVSADSRRTQWLDFYSQDVTCSRLPSANPPPRQASLTGIRPPDRDAVDLRPLPLRVSSLERKGEPSPMLTRKGSRWKALPVLPSQKQNADLSTESADVEKLMGKIMLDSLSLPTGSNDKTATQALDPRTILTNTVYTATPVTGLRTPPPTPDSASGSTATAITITRPMGSDSTEELPARKYSVHLSRPKYSLQERMWLHRNYRGEAPFLAAWGLDIASQQDREEGMGIVKELMLEESKRRV
ncbi:hypothetical protein QC762_001160 [Podospora pseudocomata]|uniref:Uncharacterized protein n=1 Tax=Podospora pseudocomata TaxID=2093779 RepID=A0ABR0GPG2_9PEZI|nr:hypothetical protein QC762_001160 [Podospora pseudocomata]